MIFKMGQRVFCMPKEAHGNVGHHSVRRGSFLKEFSKNNETCALIRLDDKSECYWPILRWL